MGTELEKTAGGLLGALLIAILLFVSTHNLSAIGQRPDESTVATNTFNYVLTEEAGEYHLHKIATPPHRTGRPPFTS